MILAPHFRAAVGSLLHPALGQLRVREVDLDADEVTLTLYDWPPAGL